MSLHTKICNDPGRFWRARVMAMQTAIKARDQFDTGICAVPDYQRFLYYTHGDLVRRIDVFKASMDDLDTLYRACQPAEFGHGGENVFDESYRTVGKLDLKSFSTLFDPRNLGIQEQVKNALYPECRMVDMELRKLIVYGKGDFFKARKDTPGDQDLCGTLVVVFPTPYEGGQLVLRQDGKEWTIDFTDKFANAKCPSVCYVALSGSMEHEVLPVTSGYRVTLIYDFYRAPTLTTTSPIPRPQHLKLKKVLVDLVNDKNILPNGGYLGFGLVQEYVHTGHGILKAVLNQLKGSDRALADVCDTLGLYYTLRLLYREMTSLDSLSLITTRELEIESDYVDYESGSVKYLAQALEGFTIKDAEIVNLDGNYTGFLPDSIQEEEESLAQFCRDRPTQVMEITRMKSSVDSTTAYIAYGNEAALEHFYGTACMLVAVEPAGSRQLLSL